MNKLKNWLVLSLFTSPAWALPLPCMNDTLTNYLASGFSCTIGDKTFASFAAILTATAALGGTATPVSTDNITVQPSGGSLDPGFSFQAAFNASSGTALQLSSVTFTVAYTGFAPAGDPFVQARLFLSNATVSGLGAITAAEALCENGSFTSPLNPLLCTGIVVNSGLLSDITNANLNATVTFDTGPVTLLGVIKQMTLSSGLGGTATASALNNGYTAAIPEPSTGAMFAGLGLVMLSLSLKRILCYCRRRGR